MPASWAWACCCLINSLALLLKEQPQELTLHLGYGSLLLL
jgi:hypothetical protein